MNSEPPYDVELRVVVELWELRKVKECLLGHPHLLRDQKLVRVCALPFVPVVGLELQLGTEGSSVVVERVRYVRDYFHGRFLVWCTAVRGGTLPGYESIVAQYRKDGWEVAGPGWSVLEGDEGGDGV